MTSPLKNTRKLHEPARRRAYNRVLFRVVAPRYHSATRWLSFWRDQAWKRIAVKMTPLKPGNVVLDCACGPGDIASKVVGACDGLTVVGLDISREMILQADSRAGWSAVQGDIARLPVRTNSIDVVTGGYALRNAPSLGGFLSEVGRVLRPGGYVTFLEFSRTPNRFLWPFQWLALWFWGSLIGLVLHGDHRVYSYIARSLATYANALEVVKMFGYTGYVEVRCRRLLFGMVVIVAARKSPDALPMMGTAG